MTALTDWVLRHRRWVALAWLLITAAGALAAPRAVDRLSYDFALPGQPAYEANVEIAERFGGGGVDDPLLLVVQGGDARTAVGDVAGRPRRPYPGPGWSRPTPPVPTCSRPRATTWPWRCCTRRSPRDPTRTPARCHGSNRSSRRPRPRAPTWS